jgi:hypothetical protein
MSRGKIVGIAAQKRRLTIEQVRFVIRTLKFEKWLRQRDGKRKRRPNGMLDRLAAKVGVSKSQIKKISKRERWRSVRVDIHPERLRAK